MESIHHKCSSLLSWISQRAAQILFIIVCTSGLGIGTSFGVYARSYLLLAILVNPLNLRRLVQCLIPSSHLWTLAFLPMAHAGAYVSSWAFRDAYSVFFVTVCGIVVGSVLNLQTLLSSVFLSLRLVVYAAMGYTLLAMQYSFTMHGGLPLWRSFFLSANSLAVTGGALGVLLMSRASESSRVHALCSVLFLFGLVCLTQNISLALAVLAVMSAKIYKQVGAKKAVGGVVFAAAVVGGVLPVLDVDLAPLLRLHGRVPQWQHYLRYFDSYWFGLGAGNILVQQYALEYRARFLFGSPGVNVDNGYLNLFFDYGILGLGLFMVLIKRMLYLLGETRESALLKDLLIFLGVMNLTGGWLLYRESPWWLILIAAASSLEMQRVRGGTLEK